MSDFRVFISYAKKDTRNLALALDEAIDSIEGLQSWVDRQLQRGRSWARDIEKQIDSCDLFVVLLSPDVNREPTETVDESFVITEIHRARYVCKPRKQILPVMVKPTPPPIEIGTTQYLDVSNKNLEDAVAEILEDVCIYAKVESPRQRYRRLVEKAAIENYSEDTLRKHTTGEEGIRKEQLYDAVYSSLRELGSEIQAVFNFLPSRNNIRFDTGQEEAKYLETVITRYEVCEQRWEQLQQGTEPFLDQGNVEFQRKSDEIIGALKVLKEQLKIEAIRIDGVVEKEIQKGKEREEQLYKNLDRNLIQLKREIESIASFLPSQIDTIFQSGADEKKYLEPLIARYRDCVERWEQLQVQAEPFNWKREIQKQIREINLALSDLKQLLEIDIQLAEEHDRQDRDNSYPLLSTRDRINAYRELVYHEALTDHETRASKLLHEASIADETAKELLSRWFKERDKQTWKAYIHALYKHSNIMIEHARLEYETPYLEPLADSDYERLISSESEYIPATIVKGNDKYPSLRKDFDKKLKEQSVQMAKAISDTMPNHKLKPYNPISWIIYVLWTLFSPNKFVAHELVFGDANLYDLATSINTNISLPDTINEYYKANPKEVYTSVRPTLKAIVLLQILILLLIPILSIQLDIVVTNHIPTYLPPILWGIGGVVLFILLFNLWFANWFLDVVTGSLLGILVIVVALNTLGNIIAFIIIFLLILLTFQTISIPVRSGTDRVNSLWERTLSVILNFMIFIFSFTFFGAEAYDFFYSLSAEGTSEIVKMLFGFVGFVFIGGITAIVMWFTALIILSIDLTNNYPVKSPFIFTALSLGLRIVGLVYLAQIYLFS